MKRILVIEPSKMLRYAFAVALSPEYQVETLADFPDETLMDRVDLVVVNAATLKTHGKLKVPEPEIVRAWKKPVIWLDTEQVGEPGQFCQHFQSRWPIDRDDLRKAIRSCLQGIPERSAEMLKRKKITRPEPQKIQRSEDPAGSADLSEKRLIELVDIVE
jgi:hypothetical protein